MGKRRLIALTGLSLTLSAISATVALTNPNTTEPGVWAAVAALTCASLLGIGLYAWHRGGQGRFGQVLFVTGLLWFLFSLSSSDSALLYSVGRVSGWLFEAMLVYAFASYPTGHLETRGARLLSGAAVVIVVTLYLPTIPFVVNYPVPSTLTGCAAGCPANAFFSGVEPGFIDSVVKPFRELLTVGVFASTVVLLASRLRAASHSLKRTVAPVLGAACLRFAGACAYIALRRAGVEGTALDVVRLIALLTIPATAFGILVGLLQWRIYSATALSRLTTGLSTAQDPAGLRDLVSASLAERDVGLYYSPVGGSGWVDSAGRRIDPPADDEGKCVCETETEAGTRVALVCDKSFEGYPGFLAAVSSCVTAALERQRLDAALAESLAGVAASRKRLAEASDEARRRIERDLHDGAQQQLVALRVKIELAREALERSPDDAAELIAGLGPEVEEIIDEVRSLARGIYPPLLATDGLVEALRAAGQRSPLPVSIDAEGVGRFAPETESAVYFCCLEALQNAAKHAVGATRVTIGMRGGDGLSFEVGDDGCGFAVAELGEGSGIVGIKDRLAAVGGELWIESSPGAGTRVRGRVPGP